MVFSGEYKTMGEGIDNLVQEGGKRIKHRKRKDTKILGWNPWNFDAEPGDLMVGHGKLYRLEDRKRGNMAAAGELYPRLIKPPVEGLFAILDGEDVFWIDKETYSQPEVRDE